MRARFDDWRERRASKASVAALAKAVSRLYDRAVNAEADATEARYACEQYRAALTLANETIAGLAARNAGGDQPIDVLRRQRMAVLDYIAEEGTEHVPSAEVAKRLGSVLYPVRHPAPPMAWPLNGPDAPGAWPCCPDDTTAHPILPHPGVLA